MVIVKIPKEKTWCLDFRIFFILISSFLILSSSILISYFWSIHPCKFCKIQKFLYLAIICITPFGFNIRLQKFVRFSISSILIIGFCISLFHFLIQLGLVDDQCKADFEINNINDYSNFLKNKPVPCSDFGISFFGIPSTVFNMIFLSFSFLLINNNLIKKCKCSLP